MWFRDSRSASLRKFSVVLISAPSIVPDFPCFIWAKGGGNCSICLSPVCFSSNTFRTVYWVLLYPLLCHSFPFVRIFAHVCPFRSINVRHLHTPDRFVWSGLLVPLVLVVSHWSGIFVFLFLVTSHYSSQWVFLLLSRCFPLSASCRLGFDVSWAACLQFLSP